MGLLFWTIVFVLSLGILVKRVDWFTESAERIGLALGLSSFIVGMLLEVLKRKLCRQKSVEHLFLEF